MRSEILPFTTERVVDPRFGLWQLISPTLPIGAYSYSQGLEMAIEQGWVTDKQTALDWIKGIAETGVARLDLPVLIRCYRAINNNAKMDFNHWNRYLISSRETRELRAEDVQMGEALLRVIKGIETADEAVLRLQQKLAVINGNEKPEIAYASAFALAASLWQISLDDTCAGYLWAWCENQVAAAIKLIPLGQTAGQQLLRELAMDLHTMIAQAMQLKDEEIGGAMMGLALVSSWHESQYTRLFRS